MILLCIVMTALNLSILCLSTIPAADRQTLSATSFLFYLASQLFLLYCTGHCSALRKECNLLFLFLPDLLFISSLLPCTAIITICFSTSLSHTHTNYCNFPTAYPIVDTCFILIPFLSSIPFSFFYYRSTVQSLLSDPNPASPANSEASQLYERDRGYVAIPTFFCVHHRILNKHNHYTSLHVT